MSLPFKKTVYIIEYPELNFTLEITPLPGIEALGIQKLGKEFDNLAKQAEKGEQIDKDKYRGLILEVAQIIISNSNLKNYDEVTPEYVAENLTMTQLFAAFKVLAGNIEGRDPKVSVKKQ